MPSNNKRKCHRCNRVKSDLELCGDHLLCRSCEVENAVELTKIEYSQDTQGDGDCDGVLTEKVDNLSCKDPSTPCLHCAPLYAKMQSELRELWAAHSQILKEIAELKQTTVGVKSESKDVVDQLSSEFTEIQAALVRNKKDDKGTCRPTAMKCVATAVHLDNIEKKKRSRNVVVSGLRPTQDKTDAELFLDLCESSLSVKPVFNADRCVRLGKQQGNRVRPLLVQLESEQSVSELLKSARRYLKTATIIRTYTSTRTSHLLKRKQPFLMRQFKRRDRRRNQATSSAGDDSSQTSEVHGATLLSSSAPEFTPTASQCT